MIVNKISCLAIFTSLLLSSAVHAQTWSLVEGSSTTPTSFELEAHFDLLVPIQGFSLAVCMQDPTLSSAVAIEEGSDLQLVNGGDGPDYFETYYSDTGFAVGSIVDFFETETILIPAGSGLIMLNVTFEAMIPGDNELYFCDGEMGPLITGSGEVYDSFVIENVMVIENLSVPPTTLNGVMISTSTFPAAGSPFTRGDCNADSLYDIGDAIFLLDSLFGTTVATCSKACDVNDDGVNNIADAVYALANLFSGNADPVAPYPSCGNDLTADLLECEEPACS